MTKKEEKPPQDELDLDAETIADLDPGEEAEDVRGGLYIAGTGDLCTQSATCKGQATCPDACKAATSGNIACCGLNFNLSI